MSFCAERSASSCAKSQDAAIHATVDEDTPYGFRDYARNDEIMGLYAYLYWGLPCLEAIALKCVKPTPAEGEKIRQAGA